MAPLCYAAKFDPFFSLDCARLQGEGRREGRIQILPSGNLAGGVRKEGAAVGGGGPIRRRRNDGRGEARYDDDSCWHHPRTRVGETHPPQRPCPPVWGQFLLASL